MTSPADIIGQLAELLKAEGADEVYWLGSCGTDRQRESSDLDLAVRGLPPEKFFAVLARLSEMTRLPVDLIDLDRPSPVIDYLCESGELKRVG